MEGGNNEIGEKRRSIAVGAWGGNGGSPWDDGSYNGIREITLVHARCIDSMKVVYDKYGKPLIGEKHGGVGGSKTSEIKLQFPEEYLISICGYISPVVYGGGPVIRSLTFKSNRRTFGPYGVEEGTPFSLPIEGGKIAGFKGIGGWYLDAIGCYLSPIESGKVLEEVSRNPPVESGKVLEKVSQNLKRWTNPAVFAPKYGEGKGVKTTY